MKKILVGLILGIFFGLNLFADDVELGIEFANKGDFTKANELLKKACDSGYSKGCFQLGYSYSNGQGVSQDKVKAFELYTKACDGGYAKSCHNLGYFYYKGEATKQDYYKANELFKKACDNDISTSCYNLGNSYNYGEGIKQDINTAKELYYKSCNLGYQTGCESYMKLNKKPKNFNFELQEKAISLFNDKNYSESLKLFTKLSNQNMPISTYYIGLMYEKGYGVNIDINKASVLYKESTLGGFYTPLIRVRNLILKDSNILNDGTSLSKAFKDVALEPNEKNIMKLVEFYDSREIPTLSDDFSYEFGKKCFISLINNPAIFDKVIKEVKNFDNTH